MIQGKAANLLRYEYLRKANADLWGLTYDEPLNGYMYMPGSSFAEGRNKQYEVAKDRVKEFDYFIFIDDDIEFVRGSFRVMEENLERYRPTVSIPVTQLTRDGTIGVEYKGRVLPFFKKQKFFTNDEQYLAVSGDVIKDELIFPYLEDWDETSWFVACLIQKSLIQMNYWKSALQFNNCEVLNEHHSGNYPHNLEYAMRAYRRYMSENYSDNLNRAASFNILLKIDQPFWVGIRGFFKITRAYLGRGKLYFKRSLA